MSVDGVLRRSNARGQRWWRLDELRDQLQRLLEGWIAALRNVQLGIGLAVQLCLGGIALIQQIGFLVDLVQQRHGVRMSLGPGLLEQLQHLFGLRALADQQQRLIELDLATFIEASAALEQGIGKLVTLFIANGDKNLRL